MADPVEHAAAPPPARREPGSPRSDLRVVPDPAGPEPPGTAAEVPPAPAAARPVTRAGAPTGRPPGFYRRPLAAAVVVALAVPAVHGALWLVRPATATSEARGTGPGPTGSAGPATSPAQLQPPSQALVSQLLERRARAVLDRDREAWLSTVDRSVPGLAAAQAALFDRLATVRPSSWRYELLPPDAELTPAQRAALPPGAVLEHVRLTYRLTPAAPEITHDRHVTLVPRGTWLVGGTDAGGQQRDLWDLGPVTVARGARSVVVSAAGSPLPGARTAAEADAAAARVDAVWGRGWPRTAVLFVPADAGGMATLLGRSSAAGLDQLAAVTTGESGGEEVRTSGDRVVLNPVGFAELTSAGRAAVLTHELTHVATRATSRTTPPRWVDEGFADYVAYLGTTLRPRDLAADVLQSPSTLRALHDLPTDQQFDPTKGKVGTAYAEAWLAMRFIARDGGSARVVDFYRVATGLPALRRWPPGHLPTTRRAPRTDLERACVQVLGYVEPSFVRRWVVYVRAVAASS